MTCPKCNDTGWYVYSTRGTPHSTICDLCCKHDKGWWMLEKYYGYNNGKFCCRGGCGTTITPDEYNEKCDQLLLAGLFK
jgi:hypothetical protein